ncbi:MAG: hypothetical protein P8Y53_22160 [Pseudolabrys sp.]
MARYSPELLAALRQRYEGTDQPMRQLARDFGIGISTLSALVEKEGWLKRSQRPRGSPAAPRLAEATALMASLPPRPTGAAASEPVPADRASLPPPAASVPDDERTAAERLEALLVQEIAAEEAARAELGTLPRLRTEADGCARRLAVLTQTLKTLRAIPAAAPPAPDDHAPQNIDEFRETLARRIQAFIAEKVGTERYAMDRQIRDLTDDELRELIQLGRERGMEALLRPPADAEEVAR